MELKSRLPSLWARAAGLLIEPYGIEIVELEHARAEADAF